MKIKKSAFYIFTMIFSLHSSAFAEPSVADVQYRAQQGQPIAQYHLGIMLLTGEGTPKNLQLAKKWFQQAANTGDVDAKEMLKSLERKIKT
ncbi:SEL1-like repeat protein [Acinetobacter sp. UC24323]|nr:SEL1-like repeat protein [Acinetobacter sp. UC24323]